MLKFVVLCAAVAVAQAQFYATPDTAASAVKPPAPAAIYVAAPTFNYARAANPAAPASNNAANPFPVPIGPARPSFYPAPASVPFYPAPAPAPFYPPPAPAPFYPPPAPVYSPPGPFYPPPAPAPFYPPLAPAPFYPPPAPAPYYPPPSPEPYYPTPDNGYPTVGQGALAAAATKTRFAAVVSPAQKR